MHYTYVLLQLREILSIFNSNRSDRSPNSFSDFSNEASDYSPCSIEASDYSPCSITSSGRRDSPSLAHQYQFDLRRECQSKNRDDYLGFSTPSLSPVPLSPPAVKAASASVSVVVPQHCNTSLVRECPRSIHVVSVVSRQSLWYRQCKKSSVPIKDEAAEYAVSAHGRKRAKSI